MSAKLRDPIGGAEAILTEVGWASDDDELLRWLKTFPIQGAFSVDPNAINATADRAAAALGLEVVSRDEPFPAVDGEVV